MQLKINKFLNTLSLFVLITAVIIFVFVNFIYPFQSETAKTIFYFAFIAFTIGFFFFFKYLENRWDKKIILRMIEEKNIALAEIKSVGAVQQMRDSGFKNYVIYKIEMEVIKENLKREKIVCYEKFNRDVLEVPKGHVYITYDEARPDHVFIIQNDLLPHFPELEPIVSNYEKKVKNLKYLSVIQNNGLIIRTFKQHLKGAN